MIDLQPGIGRALVVGGGNIAARKVRSLVEAEFEAVVIAPEVVEEIRLKPHVSVIERAFEDADVDGAALVIAATDDRAVNERVGQICRARGIPVLVTDRQDESTFFSPAVLRDGDLAVAVSTGGASPALARAIRERIAGAIGQGWAQLLHQARIEREVQRMKGGPGTE